MKIGRLNDTKGILRKKMRASTFILSIILSIVFAAMVIVTMLISQGCGLDIGKVESGEIYDKVHEPRREYQVTGQICVMVGKVVICTPYTHTNVDDEDWILYFRRPHKHDNEKWRQGKCYVSKSMYDQYEIGQNFDIDEVYGEVDFNDWDRRKR